MTSNPSSKPAASITTTVVSAPKPPCTIHSDAIVSDKAIFTGTHQISIAAHAVVQPYARVRAEGGRVSLGTYCTVSEAAVVGLPTTQEGDVNVGEYVTIESGAEVMAASIGDSTEVGIKAIIGAGSVIGKHCKICPKMIVKPGEILDDFTVVYGDAQRRRDTATEMNTAVREARIKGQVKHVEALRKVIPNAAGKFLS